ncbi:LysR substrate-binding domain-containing protein [Psychromonas ossibalaenae]|uniref:LysR substrate-binding domain-containing protein n=1 Tax=Psychromonas ossibalaenae TaxID=444922 RepID=UPI000361DE36|nr:LysR substrate-binding domain-containing protein [Psychromonas ossibalaenae]
MNSKQNLLANMHTFSIAARCLSFTLAAEQLHLTQSAVSHRIKKLEQELGFKVFIRLTRRLALTPEGERLLTMFNHSFDLLFSELDDIRSRELSGELYIGTSPYFASAWLIPRLAEFQALYPNLNIKLQASEKRVDFQFEPIDLAIYYSKGDYPECFSQRLFSGIRLPVCSKQYAEKFKLEQGLQNLKEVNFIHSASDSAWKYWLTKMELDKLGIEINCMQRRSLFSHNDLSIEAARFSMGVAMGRLEFVRDQVDSGELVAPFAAVDSGKGYDLVCPQGLQNRAKFQAFSKWIFSQIDKNQRI